MFSFWSLIGEADPDGGPDSYTCKRCRKAYKINITVGAPFHRHEELCLSCSQQQDLE
jgi:hypothetical protein